MIGELRGSEIARGNSEIIKNIFLEIMATREEIITAFVAKYGCGPDEIEQVEEIGMSKLIWYLRRRVNSDATTNPPTAGNPAKVGANLPPVPEKGNQLE